MFWILKNIFFRSIGIQIDATPTKTRFFGNKIRWIKEHPIRWIKENPIRWIKENPIRWFKEKILRRKPKPNKARKVSHKTNPIYESDSDILYNPYGYEKSPPSSPSPSDDSKHGPKFQSSPFFRQSLPESRAEVFCNVHTTIY